MDNDNAAQVPATEHGFIRLGTFQCVVCGGDVPVWVVNETVKASLDLRFMVCCAECSVAWSSIRLRGHA